MKIKPVSEKIKPLSDHLLVQRAEPKDTVKGGIVIPDSAKEKPQEAIVKAVGPGKRDDDGKRIQMDMKIGQRILITKYGGTEVKFDDEEYMIIREEDVLAIIGD
jgi:chaperonin GroES